MIQEEVLISHPALCLLIEKTESMDQTEKQYWFDVLPIMTNEQIDRLFDILEIERRKLEELEKKYEIIRNSMVQKIFYDRAPSIKVHDRISKKHKQTASQSENIDLE